MAADPEARPREPSRRDRADATRLLLLQTAERLYAERGLAEVSNRQVAEAAGQANNSAVAYHVGTKRDLVLAIARSHSEATRRRTDEMVLAARGSRDPRDHVACLVLPYTEHLADLGTPSWCARFTAQLLTDPSLGAELVWDAKSNPSLRDASDAIWSLIPDIPPEDRALRVQMIRLLIVHMCADRERVFAETRSPGWAAVGESLIDALTGLLLGPGRRHDSS